jgi:ubiquinone/menaquinone biosynthesis C-methylase UbiE
MSVDPIAADAFDAMAAEYERGRPGWPAGAIASLLERFGARTVLDLAAGTGKLTDVLVAHAGQVVAVEPVDGMRRVLEARLPSVGSLAGTAEAIPLPDGSVDAVFVGEAFHWPDDRRAAALGTVRELLERHGVDEVTLRYRTTITTARRVDG